MTGEKRCDGCGWEFYELDYSDDDYPHGVCPECGCYDWEFKLTGKEAKK